MNNKKKMLELFFEEYKKIKIAKNCEVHNLYIKCNRLYKLVYIFLFISAILLFLVCICFICGKINVLWYAIALMVFILVNVTLMLFYIKNYKVLISKNRKDYIKYLENRIITAKQKCLISDDNNKVLYALIENKYIERRRSRNGISPLDGINRIIVPAVLSLITLFYNTRVNSINNISNYITVVVVLYCLYYIICILSYIVNFISSNIVLSEFELKELYENYLFYDE